MRLVRFKDTPTICFMSHKLWLNHIQKCFFGHFGFNPTYHGHFLSWTFKLTLNPWVVILIFCSPNAMSSFDYWCYFIFLHCNFNSTPRFKICIFEALPLSLRISLSKLSHELSVSVLWICHCLIFISFWGFRRQPGRSRVFCRRNQNP